MESNDKKEPKEGVLTTSMNIKTQEFTAFQLLLKNKADSLDEQQKLRIELLGLQIKKGR